MGEKRIVVEDTRQQVGKHDHIENWFKDNSYKIVRTKLFCGDYTYLDNQTICVDTKKDIQEIVSNVTSQHKRFTDEIKRANENGIKLYFIIQDEYITKIEELNRWWNPRLISSPKATRGSTLFKILWKLEKEYGTKFYFSKRCNCAETIIKILDGEM